MINLIFVLTSAYSFGLLDYYCDSKHYEGETISIVEMNYLVGVDRCINCTEEYKARLRDRLRDNWCKPKFWFLYD